LPSNPDQPDRWRRSATAAVHDHGGWQTVSILANDALG
jgi:hypothetical protein